jgi:hypothetical protein
MTATEHSSSLEIWALKKQLEEQQKSAWMWEKAAQKWKARYEDLDAKVKSIQTPDEARLSG